MVEQITKMYEISIHALREESDFVGGDLFRGDGYFNPRSP